MAAPEGVAIGDLNSVRYAAMGYRRIAEGKNLVGVRDRAEKPWPAI